MKVMLGEMQIKKIYINIIDFNKKFVNFEIKIIFFKMTKTNKSKRKWSDPNIKHFILVLDTLVLTIVIFIPLLDKMHPSKNIVYFWELGKERNGE